MSICRISEILWLTTASANVFHSPCMSPSNTKHVIIILKAFQQAYLTVYVMIRKMFIHFDFNWRVIKINFAKNMHKLSMSLTSQTKQSPWSREFEKNYADVTLIFSNVFNRKKYIKADASWCRHAFTIYRVASISRKQDSLIFPWWSLKIPW